jgi:hypothetical protein
LYPVPRETGGGRCRRRLRLTGCGQRQGGGGTGEQGGFRFIDVMIAFFHVIDVKYKHRVMPHCYKSMAEMLQSGDKSAALLQLAENWGLR